MCGSEAYTGGRLWGLSPPPEPVKSIDFRGFQASTGAEPQPGKRKKFKPPPGQIPEYAPGAVLYIFRFPKGCTNIY